MSIEKYKEQLEEAIYECCGKFYIGGQAVQRVLKQYHEDQLKLPDIPDVDNSVCPACESDNCCIIKIPILLNRCNDCGVEWQDD